MTEKDTREVVYLSKEEYTQLMHTAVRNTVHATLVGMNLKASSLQSGKIYRSEMIEIIGRRAFDNAVREGHLRTYKNNPLKRNSKVYCSRCKWWDAIFRSNSETEILLSKG